MRKITVLEHITLDGVIQAGGGPDEDTSNGFAYGGWCAPFDDEAIGAGYRRDDVLLELTFVETDDEGRVLIPFADGPAVWSTTPFGDVTRELLGVRCRTVPLPVLRTDKSTPREDDDDAVKDVADHEALSRL